MVLHATNYTQRKQNSITNTIQFLTTLVFFVFLNNLDCFSKTTGVWTVRSGKSSKNATERVVGWHGKCVGCLIWDLHFVCSWQDCFALSTRKNMKTEQFCPPPTHQHHHHLHHCQSLLMIFVGVSTGYGASFRLVDRVCLAASILGFSGTWNIFLFLLLRFQLLGIFRLGTAWGSNAPWLILQGEI